MGTQPSLIDLPMGRALWSVAWPMICLGLARTLYLLVDAWWVGQLGDVALTALAAGSFGWWITDHLCELAAVGVHSLVARAIGAGDREQAKYIAGQGLWLGLGLWAAIAVAQGPLVRLYVTGVAVEGEVAQLTGAWLSASIIGSLGVMCQAVLSGVFRGVGRTGLALMVMAGSLLANCVLDPLFIWGLGPVPELGISGAAWATGLSALLGAGVAAALLKKMGLSPAWRRPAWADIRRVAQIGGPIALTGVAFASVYVALGRMVVHYGEIHLAALGIGHRLEGVTYLGAVGLAVATSTLVGQNLGAGRRERAREVVRLSARVTAVVMLALGLPVAIFAEELYGLFAEGPELVDAGVVYLRFQALAWVCMGLEMIYEGAFTGWGKTTPAMVIGGTLTIARLPMAWFFGEVIGLGVVGIWVAIALSTISKGVILGLTFRRVTAFSPEEEVDLVADG